MSEARYSDNFLSIPSTPELGIWLILALAVVMVFAQQRLWPVVFVIAIATAFTLKRVDGFGLGFLVIGFLITWQAQKQSHWKLLVLHLLAILWATLLMAHLAPGFTNLNILNEVVAGANSTPFSLYLNLDKPILIFMFIMLMPEMLNKPCHPNFKIIASSAILILVLLPAPAYLMGLVRPELSSPDWILLFAFNNLLFTCASEEVFFRGYLQNLLAKYGPVWSVGTSSLLFGLAHYAGGLPFIIFASLAGVSYGLIYLATGRLYLAILAHFIFNLSHLLFFTYPLSH